MKKLFRLIFKNSNRYTLEAIDRRLGYEYEGGFR